MLDFCRKKKQGYRVAAFMFFLVLLNEYWLFSCEEQAQSVTGLRETAGIRKHSFQLFKSGAPWVSKLGSQIRLKNPGRERAPSQHQHQHQHQHRHQFCRTKCLSSLRPEDDTCCTEVVIWSLLCSNMSFL